MNCRWGSYQPWSECTKTCGGGTRESIREVEQKEEHGGLPCVGSAKRIVACNKETCPGDTFVSADLKYIHMLDKHKNTFGHYKLFNFFKYNFSFHS